MFLVILAVSLIVVFGSYEINRRAAYKSMLEKISEWVCVVGVGFSMVSMAALLALTVVLCRASLADEKLTMYEEENTNIEVQIADIIAQYQKYEKDTFENASADSSITRVSLYPELKSDTLVQQQINMYMENNNRIKELREDLILGDAVRFWLYFGGK